MAFRGDSAVYSYYIIIMKISVSTGANKYLEGVPSVNAGVVV